MERRVTSPTCGPHLHVNRPLGAAGGVKVTYQILTLTHVHKKMTSLPVLVSADRSPLINIKKFKDHDETYAGAKRKREKTSTCGDSKPDC